MTLRTLMMMALGALFIAGAAVPAQADDDWGWRQRREHEWREREWREHERREHAWHDERWRDRHDEPPVVVAPVYPAPPPGYYANPAYSR